MAGARTVLLLISAIFLLSAADSARILGLFPYKGASHFWVFKPLMEELARRGHSVTVASHLPRDSPLANYTDISLKTPEDSMVNFIGFESFENSEMNSIEVLLQLHMLREGYDRVLANPKVLGLANTSFDLVIIEQFNSDLFFGLTYKIGAPVIVFSSCEIMTWIWDTFGLPIDLPYLRHFPGGHKENMGFIERIQSTLEKWMGRAFYRYLQFVDQKLAEKYLGPLPPLADIAANSSLLFVNTHFTLFGNKPYPQSIIEVGGINVQKPKPLPTDLEKILNGSESVIYFSMGSVLNSSSISPEKEKMLLNAFIASGRTVLWKREKDLDSSHPNIFIRPWFPQRDVLAHPKVDLFIAHCGLLGLNEAVVSGVPLICIPLYGDQTVNSFQVVDLGIGLKLSYATLSEEKLKFAINEILNNKIYKQRAVEVAAAYNNRPMTPLDTAVFWSEYLLHHGPRPFQAPYKRMPLWQRLGLDIISVFLGMITIFLTIASILLRKLSKHKNKTRKEVSKSKKVKQS